MIVLQLLTLALSLAACIFGWLSWRTFYHLEYEMAAQSLAIGQLSAEAQAQPLSAFDQPNPDPHYKGLDQ